MQWSEDTGRDVTAVFKGVTTPVRELLDEIHRRGWTVTNVKWKGEGFVAEAKNPYGEKLKKTGPTDNTALANLLVAVMRRETIRYQSRTASWSQTWDDQLAEIAHAYAEAPVYDPKAAGAWKELAEDMMARAAAIMQQIQVEVTDDPHPYKTVQEMCEDVRKKHHILVSRAHADHPLWSTDQVVAYRLVRDVLGHCNAGGDYGWFGENRATAALMPLLSPNAQKALFTESIGKAAYNHYYRAFGPQKICFLDGPLKKIQEEENGGGHGGIHPSQSIIPGQLPDMREKTEKVSAETLPAELRRWEYINGSLLRDPKRTLVHSFDNGWNVYRLNNVAAVNQVGFFMRNCWQGAARVPPNGIQYHSLHDPQGLPRAAFYINDQGDGRPFIHAALGMRNRPISPEHAALLQEYAQQYGIGGSLIPKVGSEEAQVTDPNAGWQSNAVPLPDNAYLWIKEKNGLDPADWMGQRNYAHMLDTGWHKAMHPDGRVDLDTQRQAVANALRAVLMAPRKPMRWGVTHYQHLMGLPATTSDPMRFWDTLENHRGYHNLARGLPANAHRIAWEPELQAFKGWAKALYPKLHDAKIDQLVRKELFHMIAEEEERITQDDADHKLSAMEVENMVQREIQRRLKTMTKNTVNDKMDFEANIMNQPDPGAYGSFLMSSLKPLAAVGHHSHTLLSAARQDVANNGGKGHHWRKTALSLGIPGLGPKEASFAWLLLQPHTSQLAVLNPEMAEILGHRPEELSPRDYFKWERELAAGRDAAGYGHMPLGQFGWSLWDYRRGGSGYHTDHQPMRPLYPQPHDQVDWMNREAKGEGSWDDPYWWKATQPARDQAAGDFDSTISMTHPKSVIPFQRTANNAFEKPAPWIQMPDGEQDVGAPGETIMQYLRGQYGMSTADAWKQIAEAGKNAA